ncbi:putative nucleic acid-binding protein [Rosa chinensis]|uniref:CST complex subunit STN1 n=1 Tax=Rosa chinensis TaxID=74649 RepID=A0A2P6PVU5_ROSCH|nr:CST complex subunit STN1 [Rosa chinensis]PRQ26055.1 putative nucleic acid-binding protein [Rosa chinensis]
MPDSLFHPHFLREQIKPRSNLQSLLLMDHHPLHNTHVKLLAFDLLTLTQTSSSSSDPTSFSRNGLLLSRAEAVGTVTSRDLKPNKFLRFTIDDGTGCVSCILWLNHLTSPYFSRRSPPDVRLIASMAARFAADVSLGAVARVRGKVSSFRGEMQITVTDVVMERDPNAEMLHWIECMRLARKVYNVVAAAPCK